MTSNLEKRPRAKLDRAVANALAGAHVRTRSRVDALAVISQLRLRQKMKLRVMHLSRETDHATLEHLAMMTTMTMAMATRMASRSIQSFHYVTGVKSWV
jgi:hypothetical protein